MTLILGRRGACGSWLGGIDGTNIDVSAKHFPKYLGEFEYRWSVRAVPHLMLDRLTYLFAR